MAGLTKAQRAEKEAKLLEESNPGIKVINVADDNEVLKKLNLQDAEDQLKLKKSMQNVDVNIPTGNTPAVKGMVNFYDTVTGRKGSEKENIFKSMEKFNKEKYKRI